MPAASVSCDIKVVVYSRVAVMYMAVCERLTLADDVLERSLATTRFAALLTSPMTRAALFVAA